MPPEHPLSFSEKETLRLWIASMNVNSPTPPAPPTPTPAPTPPPTPTPTPPPPAGPQATFSYIEKNILASSCVACHSAKTARGGVALDTYAAVLKTVNKKSPTKSLLYKETQSGSMPPRPRKVLNSEQLQLILTWIEQGALNN
ncbi:Planctomycete cytochrome C [compost metagenome]